MAETLVIQYSDPLGIYEPAVLYSLGSNVRFGALGVSQSAELGQSSISTIEADDPGGILNIVGLRAIVVKETAAPSNNQVVFRGVIQDRVYKRSEERSLITGSDRLIAIDATDYNWHLGSRRFVDADADRPAETPGDRIRWLLSSAAHITLFDYGYVTYPTTPVLEATDYRSQTPMELLADCCVEGQYNFWCDVNEAHGRAELFFIDPDSADYASDLAVSNDVNDVDSETIFAPYMDAELRRSPSRLAYGVLVAHPKGWVYVRNDTTGLQYGRLDQVAPMSNVKSAARARRLGNVFLAANDEESDKLTFSLKVPAASVNGIRAGHVMSVKFTHLPGYEDWRSVRVLHRDVVQENEGGEDYYLIKIVAVPGGTILQPNTGGIVYEAQDDLGASPAGTKLANWRSDGDSPGAGLIYDPLQGDGFTYYDSGGYRVGFTVVADSGELDMYTFVSAVWAHTGHADLTLTASILKNGVAVASQSNFHAATGSFGGVVDYFNISVSDVPVVAGDVLTVNIVKSDGGGFTIPSGTGEDTHFEILPTSRIGSTA